MTIYEQERHEFASILTEIKKLDGVKIINESNEGSFSYVTFEYMEKIWYIQPSPYYPFTDINHPGKFNFIPYEKRGDNKCQQNDYWQAYNGPDSLRNFVFRRKPVNDAIRPIVWYK